eukprot:13455240-Alexandrium_andersonii.AAC.1
MLDEWQPTRSATRKRQSTLLSEDPASNQETTRPQGESDQETSARTPDNQKNEHTKGRRRPTPTEHVKHLTHKASTRKRTTKATGGNAKAPTATPDRIRTPAEERN